MGQATYITQGIIFDPKYVNDQLKKVIYDKNNQNQMQSLQLIADLNNVYSCLAPDACWDSFQHPLYPDQESAVVNRGWMDKQNE